MASRPLRWLAQLVTTTLLFLPLAAGRRELVVGVRVSPDDTPHPDPTVRIANTSGNGVTFTVTNTGDIDTRYTGTCTGTGAVLSVTCPYIGFLIPGESKNVTVTFTTGTAGGGTVRMSVTSSPAGATGAGRWDETVVNPAASVTPHGASMTASPNTASSFVFTVTNTGTTTTTYTLVAVCSGAGVTGCSPSPASVTLAGNQSQSVTASFTTQGAGTTGVVELRAQVGGTTLDAGTVNVSVAAASVTPDGAPVTLPPNIASYSDFTVTNTGGSSVTYTLVAVCSGAGVSGCSPSPASLLLEPSTSGTVRVSFTTGAVGTTGVVELRAQLGSTVLDVGTVNVTVSAPLPLAPAVDVASVNPDVVLARGQCLTISIASAAASECGDLRIAHPLPSVRTMNVWRTPTLAYTSAQAIGWVSVSANVTLPVNSQVPATVTAQLKIGGVTRVSGSWAGSQWTPGETRRIALGFSGPAVGLTTGVHDYVLEVTNVYSGSSQTTPASGKLVIVDRSGSSFGAGWWLAGLEQWNPATAVWIGGDGSVRQYTLRPGSVAPNRVWGIPAVTYPDSIREAASEFIRQLPDSVWVYFDAQGRHVRTRNRQGHVTTFAYDAAGRVITITLPPAASPLSYSVTYDGNGRVSTIVAPGVPLSRTTTFTINATTGRLTTILEPDGRTVAFGYGGDNKIVSRTDRRSTVTDFQFDAGGRVSQATINLSPGTITRTLRQASSQGYAGTSVPLSQAFTRLDGPRLVNTTSFYLNRFGAPDTIIDALGQRTRLLRSDTRFPGVVTQLTTVTGHTIAATYDERGRILTSSEPSTSGLTATTTYVWDGKWDQVTRITNPEGDFMEFGVDPVTGNRLWQQDGRGASTRTRFDYYPDNQLANLIPPASGYHSYGYDAKGNLQSYFSALDMRFTWTNNNIGLTTQIQTPTGPCCQPGWSPHQTETVDYSVRNEDTLRVVTLAGQSTTVKRKYDEVGNLTEVTRTFSPNPAGIVSLVTSWQYDRANRPFLQTEPDSSVERRWFDAAGSLDSLVTRRGLTISMTYDALNRLRTRTVPAVSYSLPPTQIPQAIGVTLPYNYTWTADNQGFQYTPDGQVSLATSKDAAVTRTFHASGRLLTETLDIKSTDRTTIHSYTTTYTYDRNGRRTSMTAPALFAGGPIGYGYDQQWGALTSVTDIAGNAFGFTYNERSELTRIGYGGGISETLGYDGDGRLSSDVITNGPSQTFPYYPGPQLRNFVVGNRNARGQILSSRDTVQSDQVTATHSGLGYLLTSNLRQELVNVTTGGPARYASADTTNYDGLGNILTTVFWDSTHDGRSWSVTRRLSSNTYTPVGRVNTHQTVPDLTSYSYDAAGNTYFEGTNDGVRVTTERAAYYAPDDKVVATDTRAPDRRRTLEEYRYDALGRRVWVKSVMTCEPSSQGVECNTPYVRRTIWDGLQELAEIQAPVDLDNPQTEEADTGHAGRSWNFSPADPNPFYGRVVYGPGLAVDQPLSVTRYDYRDKPGTNADWLTWQRFTWQIYWNYQGLPAYGTLTTGAWAYPNQLGPNQPSCPPVGNQTPQRCVLVQWPLAHSAYDRNRRKVQYPSWHGSLLEGKRDRSGLEYRRNRMYDPATGRFTQEDPIGLAGGLNQYGFAAGDPVNFSDPFGLCAQSDTLETVTVRQCATENPSTAVRQMCVDRATSGSVQEIFNLAAGAGISVSMNNAYRDRITAGTGGRPGGRPRSLHRAGLAFDINSRALTARQLATFTSIAQEYGFFARADDPGHFEVGDRAATSSEIAEADRSYAAGECTDANVEAVRSRE
jgi:RHS repeat-associated protein